MISVNILTKNSRKHIGQVLEALKEFPEVLVLDTGSSDDTMEIVKTFPNVTLHEMPFTGFGELHNKAASLSRYDWILSIDSDEVMTPELKDNILQTNLDEDTVYVLSFKNFYNGKWIRHSGWYPDRHYRLYNRKKTGFSEAKVHESIQVKGMKISHLEGFLHHYSYGEIRDFLSKMQAYSTLFAEQYQGKKSSSPFKAILHGSFSFFKSYVLKRGFLDGREGWIIAAYNGHTAFYKYLKLWELGRDIDS